MPWMGTARHLPVRGATGSGRLRYAPPERRNEIEMRNDTTTRCTADAVQCDIYARRNATRAERAKRATQVGLPRHAVGVKPTPIRPNVAVGELA